VVVPEEFGSVSNSHARIRYDDALSCYVLEDLESANGTRLDGVPVERPQRLERLHVITLAQQVDYVFRDLSAQSRPTATPVADPVQRETVAKAPAVPLEKAASDKTVVETKPERVTDATRVEPTTAAQPLSGTRVERPADDDSPVIDKTKIEDMESTQEE